VNEVASPNKGTKVMILFGHTSDDPLWSHRC